MIRLERRRFLVTAAACGGASVWACGPTAESSSTTGGDPSRSIRVKVSELPASGVIEVGQSDCGATGGVLVGRDAQGVYAYSNVCTHQGGRVPAPDSHGVSKCCLHGSTFDQNGDLLKGITASQKSLPHLDVRLEGSGADATIVVRLDVELGDRTTRLKVT